MQQFFRLIELYRAPICLCTLISSSSMIYWYLEVMPKLSDEERVMQQSAPTHSPVVIPQKARQPNLPLTTLNTNSPQKVFIVKSTHKNSGDVATEVFEIVTTPTSKYGTLPASATSGLNAAHGR